MTYAVGFAPTRLDEAIVIAQTWKKCSEKIVFTNGCFDLLHRGHVHYLDAARRLGDVLVVGINDDDSVRRLKGPTRPLLLLQDRATLLAALKPVDMVVTFAQDTPLQLIRAIQPDVLVKGGDYDLDDIVGGEDVRGWGGIVTTIPFVEGYSTTGLLARLQQLS
ncbi:MAG: D-glycero-beta-D-manno-heptose 1-phosphate adenylyltransferase [Mariprofundaceae bacterium]